MDPKEFEDAVQFCIDLKSEGKSYDQINSLLSSKNVLEEEIKILIKEADKRYLSGLIEGKKEREFNYKWLGLALIFTGIAIAFASIIWVENFNGTYFIFMFGPIVSGSAIYYGGRRKQVKYFSRKQDHWNRRF